MDVEHGNCGCCWDSSALISSDQSNHSSPIQTFQRIASAIPCNCPSPRTAELICETTYDAYGGNSERVLLKGTGDVRIRGEGGETAANRVASYAFRRKKLGNKEEEEEEEEDWQDTVLRRLEEKFEEEIMEDIRERKAARRLKAEATKALEWYAILQGVIYLSAANTSLFTCSDLWGPAIVSIIIAIATATIVAASPTQQPTSRSNNVRDDTLQIRLSDIIVARTKLLTPQISVGKNSLGKQLSLALFSESGLDDESGLSDLGNFSADHIVALPLTASLIPILLLLFSMFVILSCSVILCKSNPCPCQKIST